MGHGSVSASAVSSEFESTEVNFDSSYVLQNCQPLSLKPTCSLVSSPVTIGDRKPVAFPRAEVNPARDPA